MFRLTAVHATLVAGVPRLVPMKLPASLVLALKHHRAESAAFTMTVPTAAGTIKASATIEALKR